MMINCKRETYLNALDSAWSRGPKEERTKLRNPSGGLFPHGLFNYTEHGRDIDLTTWMMVLRADMRGKLALHKLAVPEFTTAEVNGRQVKKRLRPNAETMKAALDQQHTIITRMMAECPGFFAGLIEEDEQDK